MPHQRLQGDEVATALAKESIRETVTKLVRGEGSNASAFADSPHHPHQRLPACRHLRIIQAPDALVLRCPLLDLGGENVIVKLRLQLLKAPSKLCDNVWIKRQPIPVMSLPVYANPAPNKIEVRPLTPDDLRPSESGPFHQQDRGPFAWERRRPRPRQLIDAWAVDVWLPLWRTTNLARWIYLDDLFASAHPKNECRTEITFERVARALIAPPTKESRRSAVVRSQRRASG